MLNYFDWNLCLPTACYFAMSLLPYAILETDRLVSGPILHPGKAHAYLEEYVSYFLRVSVSEMGFLDKLPSVVGVSVVAAARHVEYNYTKLVLSSIQNYLQNVQLDNDNVRIFLVYQIIYASHRLSGRRSGCWRPGPTDWRACPGTAGRSCSPWSRGSSPSSASWSPAARTRGTAAAAAPPCQEATAALPCQDRR